MEIGKIFREAREIKNLTLGEAEEATKIRKFYLIALENDDFQSLPGQVYTIGFIKTYARLLGLDPAPIVDLFKNRGETPTPAARQSIRRKKKPTDQEGSKASFLEKHGWKVALCFIAAAMILFVLYQNDYFKLKQTSSTPENASTNNAVQPTVTNGAVSSQIISPANQNQTQTPAPPEKELNIDLLAKGECWMQINVDGVDVYQGTMHNGEKKTFTSKQKIILTLGNSGVIEVFRNGKSLGYLGGVGEVVKSKEFTLGGE